MSDEKDRYLQNDPARAGGLISDTQGEFVQESPGGAFDPRAFRGAGATTSPEPAAPSETAARPEHGGDDDTTGRPPMDGTRMSAPGEEIDKAG